jgi:hypothetical protein
MLFGLFFSPLSAKKCVLQILRMLVDSEIDLSWQTEMVTPGVSTETLINMVDSW